MLVRSRLAEDSIGFFVVLDDLSAVGVVSSGHRSNDEDHTKPHSIQVGGRGFSLLL